MRRFFGVALAMALMATAAGPAPAATAGEEAEASNEILAGPMVGSVSERSARVWLELSVAKEVTVGCFEVESGRQVSRVTVDVEGPLPFVCDVPVSGLMPNKNYRIEIKLGDTAVNVPGPALTIRTAPPAGSEATFTVALGSNLPVGVGPVGGGPGAIEGPGTAPVFKQIDALTPRAFLFLGNIGMLPEKLEQFPKMKRAVPRFVAEVHSKVRRQPDLLPLFRTTPCYALWSDRDYGIPDSGKEWVFQKESWSTFQRFWPNPAWGTPDVPGCYFNFTLADAEFFMLDGRMFRDAEKDAARKTMLGDSQLEWLKKGLKASKATFKIIGCGSQLLADYGQGDAWANYQPEQKDFLRWIFSNKVDGVIFVSGGRLGEITGVKPAPPLAGEAEGYPLFELTSGALAGTAVVKNRDLVNPNRRGGGDGMGAGVVPNNFGTLEFGGVREHRFVMLRLCGEDGKIKAEQTLFAAQLKK